MEIGEIKDLTQRIDDAIRALTLPRRGGTLYEHYDDGTTVKWQLRECCLSAIGQQSDRR
jgi:hypothetical protein